MYSETQVNDIWTNLAEVAWVEFSIQQKIHHLMKHNRITLKHIIEILKNFWLPIQVCGLDWFSAIVFILPSFCSPTFRAISHLWMVSRKKLIVCFRGKWTKRPIVFAQILFPRGRLKIVFCCIYSVRFPIFQYVCPRPRWDFGNMEMPEDSIDYLTLYVPAHIWKGFAWHDVIGNVF